MLKNIALFVLIVFGWLNRVAPKLDIIMLFTNNSESNDNNRALLARLTELDLDKKYRIYFFSKDAAKYKHFEQARYKSVLLAPFFFLFSKYCFYDCGTLKIKPSKKQQVISLWHGIPLKKIGLMLGEQSSRLDRYNDFTKILVPSDSWVDVYKKSFACNDEQILINGFPRNDYLQQPNFTKLHQLGLTTTGFKSNVLWMPTFRQSIGGRYNDTASHKDWDLPIFFNADDLSLFNFELARLQVQLVIKLHPYSTLNLDTPSNLSNIAFVRNVDLNTKGIINYEFVACFDSLVTDYSSVLFDYLLTDKPIGFTVDDVEQYAQGRGFTVYDPAKYLAGNKISNSDEFLLHIEDVLEGEDAYREQREALKHEVHQFVDGKASVRLLKEIKLL